MAAFLVGNGFARDVVVITARMLRHLSLIIPVYFRNIASINAFQLFSSVSIIFYVLMLPWVPPHGCIVQLISTGLNI
ncbi:hypothetical protein C8D90_104141 [Enterobacillus tribolii]|uniref:Uncharacterized protein n=1 Tax=Enterobacillus tribolii TaxID=1487935 RepID=A0A370QRV0_9GAMM|nr:hypothetical protein C8D90_104141 [Enterobacillus tribolii]